MIKAIGGHTVLDNPILTFTTSKDQLSIVEKESLTEINFFNYKFEENVYSFEQNLFMKLLLKRFLNEYDVYFYYLEKIAEPKSRLRSHKKLMYPYRNTIGRENIFEEEIELNKEKTIIYSILYLTSENIDYIYTNLMDSRFIFGFIRDKELSSDQSFEGLQIGELIRTNPVSRSRIFDLNILRVISSQVSGNASMLRVFRDGSNNDYVSLFYRNDNHLQIMKEMKNQFKIE